MTCKIDRRTRHDSQTHTLSPEAFFGGAFGLLVARHGCLIAQAIERLGAPPLAIEIEGAAWTIAIAHQGSSVTCQPGAIEGALVVTLTAQQFSELVQNQITFNGFLVARSLPFRGGSLADVSIWDSIWICLLEGWPVVGDAITFKDRSGAPLNLAQVFTPADDAEDIRWTCNGFAPVT